MLLKKKEFFTAKNAKIAKLSHGMRDSPVSPKNLLYEGFAVFPTVSEKPFLRM